MNFIGCASPDGPSYCFFSIDALGSSSTIRFEPNEQRPLHKLGIYDINMAIIIYYNI